MALALVDVLMTEGECDVCHGIKLIERPPASGSRCNRCDECVKALKESLQVGGGLRERDAFHILAAYELTEWAETGTPGGRDAALGVRGALKDDSPHRLWLDKLMKVCFEVSGEKPQNAKGQDSFQDKATGDVAYDWRRYFPGVQLKHDASLAHGARVEWSPSSFGLPIPYAGGAQLPPHSHGIPLRYTFLPAIDSRVVHTRPPPCFPAPLTALLAMAGFGPFELMVVRKKGKPITALFVLGKRVKEEKKEAGGSSRDDAADGGTGTGPPQQQGESSSGSSAGGETAGPKSSRSKRRATAAAHRPEELNSELEAEMQALSLNTSLSEAARRGDVRAIVTMLGRGKGVDEPDHYGHTPLMIASKYGKGDVVHLLLNRKADVNAEAVIERVARSPLKFAIGNFYLSVIKQLVEGGAYVNRKVGGDGTALHQAAQLGWVEATTFLLEAGADKGLRDSNGHTAAFLAEMEHSLCSHANPNPRSDFAGVYKLLTGKSLQSDDHIEKLFNGEFGAEGRGPNTWTADSAVLKELRKLVEGRGWLKGDVALRRLLEDHCRARPSLSEREGMEDVLTFRSVQVEGKIHLFAHWSEYALLAVAKYEPEQILGAASLPVGLNAELIRRGPLEVAIATLYNKVGGLYTGTLSIGNLALSIGSTCLTIVVRHGTDVVGALTLKRALLEPLLKPVFYVHLLAVDSDKVGPGRLTVGDGAEPVGDWLLSEARRQLEQMLQPGQTSYILTQSVGYNHDEATFECVPDEDEKYRKGRLFWDKHTQPLDTSTRWMALQLQFETGVDTGCCFRVTTVTRATHPANRVADATMGVDHPSALDATALDAVQQRLEAAREELQVCTEWFRLADAAHTKAVNELEKLMTETEDRKMKERKVKEKRLPFKRQELDAATRAMAEAERVVRELEAEESQMRISCIG